MSETRTDPQEAPHLPGIVPRGSDPLPEKPGPIDPTNPLVKLALQFFVIPMAIVLVCITLVFVFRWLTFEKRDLSAYVSALHSATRPAAQKEHDALKILNYIQETKRWQSIYDVTEQLRFNREKFLAQNPEFTAKVSQVFQQASGSDRKMKQYLAQVLGLVGDRETLPVLIQALKDSDSELVIHSMVAMGRIQDPSAVPALIEQSEASDPGIRQTAIFVLGSFNEPRAVDRCAQSLYDPDLLVRWNAAFALGQQKDPRSIEVLKSFLDSALIEKAFHEYHLNFASASSKDSSSPQFHPERLEQYRATAVRLLAQFTDENLRAALRATAKNDPQPKIQQAAIDGLKNLR
jgi:hypothetical protein